MTMNWLSGLHAGGTEKKGRRWLRSAIRLPSFEPLERRNFMAANLQAVAISATQVAATLNDTPAAVTPPMWIVQLDGIHGSDTQQRAAALAALASAQSTDGGVPKFTVERRLGADGLFLVAVRTDANPQQVASQLDAIPGVRYAEPDFADVSLASVPNDPRFGSQWNLNNTGQSGGRVDADIDAAEAWDLTHGSHDVVVGVIDTGIDYTHPDLAPNMWTNPGEIPGDGVDNDGNGYVDDVRGWDFVNNDNDPFDDQAHGTHVAGILGAAGNDSIGITGVAWSVQLMALKAVEASRNNYLSSLVEAVNYATMMRRDYGINVRATSNSWLTTGYSQALYDAIAASRDADMLFVSGAGNGGTDGVPDNNDTRPTYPGSFDLDNIIAVGSTTNQDAASAFSNFGPQTVDLFAPGEDVLSTVPIVGGPVATASRFNLNSGTSMANPHVTGVAALAWSLAPTATYAQVRDAIFAGVDRLPVLAGRCVTGGRVNAFGALTHLGLFVADTEPKASQIVSTAPTDFVVNFTQPIDGGSIAPAYLTVNGVPADAFALVDADTVSFHYNTSPVTNEGPQQIALAAGSVTRLADASPLAAFTRTFYYDISTMHVATISPADGTVVSADLSSIDITYSEPYHDASAYGRNVTLSQGSVTGVQLLDATTIRYSVTGLEKDGPLHVTIGPNKLRDAFGAPMGPFAATFDIDLPTRAVSNWSRIAPFGSLVYTSYAEGTISAADDVDVFNLALEAGQTLRLTVSGQGGLQPSIKVRNPSGEMVAQAAGSFDFAADTGLIVASQEGVYSLTVSGGSSSTGAYVVDSLLNATIDSDRANGPANESIQAAQNIESSFIPLDGGASRGAVVGRADLPLGLLPREHEPNDVTGTANDASANFKNVFRGPFKYQLDISGQITATDDVDWFALGTLPFVSTLTVSLSGAGGGRGTLAAGSIELYRANSGNPLLVASDQGGGPGNDGLLYRAAINIPDMYYVKIGGLNGQLGAYRAGAWLETTGTSIAAAGTNFTSESEGNDTLATANSALWRRVTQTSQTTGQMSTPDADVFAYRLAAGDGLTVVVDSLPTPDTPDTRISLRDAQGNILAMDDGTSAGPDQDSALYGYTAVDSGTYYVEVSANGGHGGYALDAYLSTTTTPPQPASDATGDVYAFELWAGEPASLALAGSTNIAARLELLDATGTVLAMGATGMRNFSVAITNFLAPQTATYYAAVHDAPDTDYRLIVTRGAAFDVEGNDTSMAATLLPPTGFAIGYVNKGAAAITVETEPNDANSPQGSFAADRALANDLSGSFLPLSGRAYRAVLTGRVTDMFQGFGEADFFKVLASPGDRIQLQVAGSNGLEPRTRIYDNQGRMLAFVGAFGTTSTTLEYSGFPYAGDYYLAVDAFRQSTLGTYTLTATLATSQPLGNTDEDFYSVNLLAGQTIVVETSTPPSRTQVSSSPFDAALDLYDPQGNLVASDQNGAPDGRNARLVVTATTAGTYSIRVRSESGGGEYLLKMTTQMGMDGDFNGNGQVEQADLDLVLLSWGQAAGSVPWTGQAATGFVDQDELDAVLLNWGAAAAASAAPAQVPLIEATVGGVRQAGTATNFTRGDTLADSNSVKTPRRFHLPFGQLGDDVRENVFAPPRNWLSLL